VVSTNTAAAATYWVFVCNPKKWAIDKFLAQNIERDTWGIRPSDRERFAPGQLGIVRVGIDQRSAAERDGRPPLEAGIYALCEVESTAFDGTGASSEFWAPGAERAPGWPTVNIRYLKSYAASPLTIERLRTERPDVSRLLLNGFQAASFPITDKDFHAVMALLGEDLDELAPSPSDNPVADQLAALERKYMNASPEVKVRVSKGIERGPVGNLVKKTNGFRCQVCEALGSNPIGFLKKNGEPYVEAHHVMPVSTKEVGSLSASNVMTVCANHHRQLHYGGMEVLIGDRTFEFEIDGRPVAIQRLVIGAKSEAIAESLVAAG
jgi:predicted RNA-binding protein with PUA-like domain